MLHRIITLYSMETDPSAHLHNLCCGCISADGRNKVFLIGIHSKMASHGFYTTFHLSFKRCKLAKDSADLVKNYPLVAMLSWLTPISAGCMQRSTKTLSLTCWQASCIETNCCITIHNEHIFICVWCIVYQGDV